MANPAEKVTLPQDWLINQICDWSAQGLNNAHVHEAMASRGGWEVWLQLELLFALRVPVEQQNGTVTREMNGIWTYSPNNRVDLWFKKDAQYLNPGENQYCGLELKCRTNLENHDTFNKRIWNDFVKCEQQPDQAFGHPAIYCVAISSQKEDINGFNPYNAANTFYTTVLPYSAKPIYVIWRKFQH